MGSTGEAQSNQCLEWCCIDRLNRHALPDISNHVGPVKHYFEQTSPFFPERVVSFVFFVFRLLGIDDHGSFVI
jgi:hypothetical protein